MLLKSTILPHFKAALQLVELISETRHTFGDDLRSSDARND
jgi:hypothetical protein